MSRLGLTGEKSRIAAASRHSQGFRNINPENGAGLREIFSQKSEERAKGSSSFRHLVVRKRKKIKIIGVGVNLFVMPDI